MCEYFLQEYTSGEMILSRRERKVGSARHFKDIDAQFAYDYGEGERTLVWWKQHLWDYYRQECADLGRSATEEMPLVCERFQVVYKL